MRVETERMGGDITAEYKDGQLYIMERIIMQNERNKKDMKNKLFLMIMVVMVCSLTACGQQETGTMTNTGNSTEQVVTSEDNSELATAEDNNMEQTEPKKQNQLQDVKPSYKEFRGILDEIDSDIQPGTAGNGMNSIKTAAHLLNWGVEPV